MLTLGCEPGKLWEANADRVPDEWNVAMTDFLPGMVTEARTNLADHASARIVFSFEVSSYLSTPPHLTIDRIK
ncbi:hypothetical protein [Halococcus agarilyticus]|uniref:hypothetical protein n=1 Tax=Halococcus agarilyticus TaxID=1232219 RepID=UPI0006781E67|nr:hypothetical protein [Halococcus agarilyticus]